MWPFGNSSKLISTILTYYCALCSCLPVNEVEHIVRVFPQCELEEGEICPPTPRTTEETSPRGQVGPFQDDVVEYTDPTTNQYVSIKRSPTPEDIARGGHFHIGRGGSKKFAPYVGNNPSPKTITECACGETGLTKKIVGGTDVPPHKYPFLVSLQYTSTGTHFCGGSLISNKYVLTAAHCISRRLPEEIQISIGDHDLASSSDLMESPNQLTVPVHTILSHKKYNPLKVFTDIALLRFKEPISFNGHVQPICLNTNVTLIEDGIPSVVAGWGVTQSFGDVTETPKETTVTAMSTALCRKESKYPKKMIRYRMMCAKGNSSDACQGDSGGPLFWKNEKFQMEQLGIVSFGIGCALADYPGVYTRLSRRKLLQWILVNTEDSVFCK